MHTEYVLRFISIYNFKKIKILKTQVFIIFYTFVYFLNNTIQFRRMVQRIMKPRAEKYSIKNL